uniref:Uncharacterized protein n=1 Tax=Panagrellus redivivus TaxID=6233 RepID=A0A7E4UP11_PANRE
MGYIKFSELPHPRKPKPTPKSARMHRNHGKRHQHQERVDYWQPPVMLNPPHVNWNATVLARMPQIWQQQQIPPPVIPQRSQIPELRTLLTGHKYFGCPQTGDFPDKKTFVPTKYWTSDDESDEEVQFLGSTAPLPELKKPKELSRKQKLKKIREMGPQRDPGNRKRRSKDTINPSPKKFSKKAKTEAQRQLMTYNDEFGSQNVKQGKKSKSSRKRRRGEREAAQKARATMSKKERRKLWWDKNGRAS